MNEEARKKVSKARTQLLLKKPFWGFLALHLEPEERLGMEIPTMGTNGDLLVYDPDFVLKTAEPILMAIVAHEVFHCAFGHIWRCGNRDKMLWNVATDIAANNILAKEGFILEGCIMEPKLAGLSAEEVYEKLPHKDGEGGTGAGNGKEGQRGAGGTKAQIVDDHAPWKEVAGGDKTDIGKDIKEAMGVENGKDRRDLESQWKDRLSRARQVAKSQGVGMGNIDDVIDQTLEPIIPWLEILRNSAQSCICTDYRLLPPNKKHIWRGIYLPSLHGERVEAGIAIDTSGSMSNDEIAVGVNEVRGVCSQFQDYVIHLWQCDDGIQRYDEINPYCEVPNKIRGRGGTSFVPVFKDIEKRGLRISLLVYFTDLDGRFPNNPPDFPVIWVATAGKVQVPFGEVIDYKKHRK